MFKHIRETVEAFKPIPMTAALNSWPWMDTDPNYDLHKHTGDMVATLCDELIKLRKRVDVLEARLKEKH